MAVAIAVLMVHTACAPLPPGVLAQRQHAALARGDSAEAVRLGRIRVEGRPDDVAARYDLACALARAGDHRAALDTLAEAIARGYDDAGWLARDEDLATLRSEPRFAALLQEASRVAREGISVAGVRTVVRDELPTPLRLRVPPEGRARLAVWLHPRGARLNAEVERLAPVLLRHGYALAVPMFPRLDGWNDAELRALLDESVPRLADVVDVERPVLLGLSAGAQAALVAWAATPERFAAVIAMAPPADLPGHALPAGGAPVVVLVGAQDPVLPAWRAALPEWSAGARRVTLREVPGKGHELLLEAALLEDVLGRLE